MNKKDQIHMVDVSEKIQVPRTATASGRIILKPETIETIKTGKIRKGDILTVAEIASIQAVKKTPDLIPLCHPIPIEQVDTSFTIETDSITATCKVKTNAKTGVEMEALTGVTVALLNIWDMTKYLEKDENGQYPDAKITDVVVTEKRKG